MSIALPTRPTRPTVTPLDARVFLYGPPKVGKTTLASQWNPGATLFLDLEGGTRLLGEDRYAIEIATWGEFDEAVALLEGGDHAYKTIVVDTVDRLYEACDRHVADGHGVPAAGQVEYGKGTSEVDARFRTTLGRLLALPVGVWLISHATLVETDKNRPPRAVPTVNKRVRDYVLGACDYVLHAERVGPDHALHCQPTERYEAGSRWPLPDELPLDARALYAAMEAARPKLQTVKSENTSDPKEKAA